MTDISLKNLPEVFTDQTPASLNRQLLRANRPIVFRRFCRHWPVVKAAVQSEIAVFDYLRSSYANVPVTVCIAPASERGRIFYNTAMTGFNFSANLESFDTFVRLISNESHSHAPRAVYMPSTDVSKWFPGLDKENNVGLDDLSPIKLIWIGNQTRIAAHYDATPNLACCIAGRRRFTLFPPEQIANLYPGPLEFAPGGQEISLVDFANPDYSKFPKFATALEQSIVVELEPGDALFLPAMWWHHVEGLEKVNILYTHWWKSSSRLTGRPSNALLHSIMSLRGLPKEQREAWQAIFNYYVFNPDLEDLEKIPPQARAMLDVPLSDDVLIKIKKLLSGRLDG